MNAKGLLKSKTFWTGLAGVITGIGLVIGGEIQAGITAIITGLGLIFVRDAIKGTEKKIDAIPKGSGVEDI